MRPPQNLRKLLLSSLVLTNLLVVLLCIFSLQQSREQYEQRAESLTQNIASALDQDVSGSIARIDLALRTVADELERQLAGKKIDETGMIAFLTRHEQRLPEVEAFRVSDANGLVILGKGLVKEKKINWADRDYFIYHRDHSDSTLHIAEPRMGRVAQQYIIGFSRRYNSPDGSFAGVISAPIALSHFAKIISRFDLGPHGTIILRDDKLGLISRFPAIPDQPAGQVGNRSVSAELRQLVESGIATASYHTRNGPDRQDRQLTYRHLAKAPMIVLAGTASQDYLAGWRTELYQTSAMALAFMLLSALSGYFMLRQLSLTQLREEMLNRSVEHGLRQQESLRRLNEIAAFSHLPLNRQLQQALAVGSKLLELEFGIISQVNGDIYHVVSQVSPDNALHDGQEFPFGNTYCNITLQE